MNVYDWLGEDRCRGEPLPRVLENSMDNNLPEQQPLRQFNIAVAILRAPSKRLQDLAPLIPKLEQLIAGIQPAPQYASILSIYS